MNDSIREKLSAYIDGALTDSERRAVEVEISRSEEMRLELEALRAVSATVKGLPKEQLPVGFMARLQARRAREDAAPVREYYILPPAYRPLAFALSTAVVALVVWDKTRAPEELIVPRAGWDSEMVSIKSAAEAPPSIDVSGQVAALGGAAKGAGDGSAASPEPTEKKEDAPKPATLGKQLSAPGKPLEFQESNVAGARGMSGGSTFAALSAPPPAPAPAASESSSYLARSEEERSAINEKLYQGFEDEKKRMGIAKIMDKEAEEDRLESGGREYLALEASPDAAPVAGRRAKVSAVRGAKAGNGRPAPSVKAITLKSAEALQAAWAAAALPGEPPAVSFPGQMAVFLAGPAGCGIVDVQERRKLIVVLYKNEGFDDPSSRVRAVAASPKPAVVKLAE